MLKRGWFGGGLWKPKNVHSLEHLRYLYTVLSKNQVVQDSNRSLLVETLRSIAEILIWGDQNDSSVFDFFLEKNMLSFFLKIMKQKCGSYVCVQLLQTLNILFENIRNETSLYYLLSNNHVNSIIVHKFDFSDEEVMAYYISFLKTLSLKLNSHTIHFFYNEHTNDFPLYTEAIKFFNHPESMVRIAVRTLTLNVYRVEDESMLRFIRDRTAAPYFSNLVWFIGNHILELDACVRTDVDHSSKTRLADLVAEHLDHLHYLNDILRLNISELNLVLADHLLNRLLVPLLIHSLNYQHNQDDRPKVSRVVALFLLAQVFLIFSYSPLMQVLARIILQGDNSLFADNSSPVLEGPIKLRPGFVAPEESLEKSLQSHSQSESNFGSDEDTQSDYNISNTLSNHQEQVEPRRNPPSVPLNRHSSEEEPASPPVSSVAGISDIEATRVNITDEEKEKLLFSDLSFLTSSTATKEATVASRPFLQSILDALATTEDDYASLFALCLLYALGHNTGVNQDLLLSSLGTRENGMPKVYYNTHLVDLLLRIISHSAQYNSKIRVVTLEMTLSVLRQLIGLPDPSLARGSTSWSVDGVLRDQHLAALEGAKEEATLLLRNFYKGEEIFLDMFEDEWRELHRRPLKVEFLLQDASILLPPTGTPLTGIDFNKRLPCGEVERARRSMRVFFLIRSLCLAVRGESDPHLPLTNPAACVQVSDVLDLNNSDLIGCVVITRDNQRTRRFLVIDVIQLILVEPEPRKIGWGVAKFVGFLQDLEVTGDKDDSRVLHLTIHRPSSSSSTRGRPAPPLLAGKFIFDDHIRCMAAKQKLTKGRLKARQRKLHQIARLLEMPTHLQPCPSPPPHALHTMRQEAHRRGGPRGAELRPRSGGFHKGKFTPASRGPGMAQKKEGAQNVVDDGTGPPPVGGTGTEIGPNQPPRKVGSRAASRSTSRPRPRSEEIPLENLTPTVAERIQDAAVKNDCPPEKELSRGSEVPEKTAACKSIATSQSVNIMPSPFSVCSVPEQVPFQPILYHSVISSESVHPLPAHLTENVPILPSTSTPKSENGAISTSLPNCEDVSPHTSESEAPKLDPHEETSFSSQPSCPKSSSFDFFEDQSPRKTGPNASSPSRSACSSKESSGTVSPCDKEPSTLLEEETPCDSKTSESSVKKDFDPCSFSPLRTIKSKGKIEII